MRAVCVPRREVWAGGAHTRCMETGEWDIDRARRGSDTTRHAGSREWAIDRVLAREAARGPFTRAQLITAGLPPDAIDRRMRSGQLLALWPGVYWLAGPPLDLHAQHLAATLACGPRAVLSGFSGAVEWAVLQAATSAGPIHVTARRAPAPSRGRRRAPCRPAPRGGPPPRPAARDEPGPDAAGPRGHPPAAPRACRQRGARAAPHPPRRAAAGARPPRRSCAARRGRGSRSKASRPLCPA